MKKTFKILVLITIFLVLFITNANAAGILMNLENAESTSGNLVETENNTDNTIKSQTNNNFPQVVYSQNSSSDNFLSPGNILSIIIIVIGVLIVLLAIALLVRFK